MLSWLRDLLFSPDGKLQRDVVIGAVFLPIGIVVGLLVDNARRAWAERKEARENQHIDLSGTDWFAAWEASVDGNVIINTEHISISQSGSKIFMQNLERSPENPQGGYLWKGQLTFSHGESLMGWYYPRKEENITSRGIMYFSYDSQRHVFAGQWVGKSYDGNLCKGFACIAKDRDGSRTGVLKLIEMAKAHPVNVLGGATLSIDRQVKAVTPAIEPPLRRPNSD